MASCRCIGWLIAVMALGSGGCSLFHPRLDPQRLDQGYTIVLPGIEGESLFNGQLARGLVDGGVPTAIEVDDWTSGFAPAWLFHLRGAARHERESERIAAKIVAYRREWPGRPVYLVGHSGGGAMAVRVLERLPPDVTVTRALLLAPAITPEYDLTRALAATDGGIWNFLSPGDALFCGLGTTLFGTVDGSFRPSAGMVGFRRSPRDALIGQIEPGAWLSADGSTVPLEALQWGPELRQVPYRPEMFLSGHPGGHFGWTSRPFARRYLAPLLRLESAPR